MNKIILLFTVLILASGINAQSKKTAKKPTTPAPAATVVAPPAAPAPPVQVTEVNSGPQIEWMNLNDALAKTSTSRKKILIDFITDWCTWCKVMDKKTYTDPLVIETMNKYFHAVKFNAEKEGTIKYKGTDYVLEQQGIKFSHSLANKLLKGNLAFPTSTFLTMNHEFMANVPGYIDAKEMVLYLRYFGEDKYKSMGYDEFKFSESNK